MLRVSIRVASLVGAVALLAPAMSAEVTLPIRIRAWAVNMSNNLTGANAGTRNHRGQMVLRRRTYQTSRDRAQGQDALLRALQKLPVKGRVRIPAGPDPIPRTTDLVGTFNIRGMNRYPKVANGSSSPQTAK